MSNREVRFRALADADVTEAVDHYRDAGDERALRFVDAVERAVRQIQRSPSAGSQHFSYELGIPELRARKVGRLPYVIFYVARAEHVDVWRVLHSRRDITQGLHPEP